MALPHSYDEKTSKPFRDSAAPAVPGDRVGNISVHQLEKWLELFPAASFRKPTRHLQPWQSFAVLAISTLLLWSAIIYVAYLFW